jgi:hypothetical protein
LPTGDPFEAYRWKREIERMEGEFRDNASARRERLEQLSRGEEDTLEFERKVSLEVQDFLSESVSAAERMLSDISEGGDKAGEAESEIRQKLEALIAGALPPTGEMDDSGVPPEGEGGGSIRRRAIERRAGRRPVDLRAVLTRIRRGTGANPDLPPEPSAAGAPKPINRKQLLATFDETCHQVTHLLHTRLSEDSVEIALPLADAAPAEAEPGPGDLAALRLEVARLRKAVEALVRRGVLSEADLS